MELSEAIEMGSMLGKQVFGGYGSEYTGTCALGAAALAAGLRRGDGTPLLAKLDKIFPILNKGVESPCCCFDGQKHSIACIIPHLNDYHEWTREQIARWVRSFEAAADNPTAITESSVYEFDACVLI
jgi:hypothetical protein